MKAQIVYRKCIRAGKIELARNIAYKYNVPVDRPDDMVISLSIAMMYRDHKSNQST
jgi:hypothetical protein